MSTIKVETMPEDGKGKVVTFRRVLLTKCQQEFEKDKKEDEERETMLSAIKETEDVSSWKGLVFKRNVNKLTFWVCPLPYSLLFPLPPPLLFLI